MGAHDPVLVRDIRGSLLGGGSPRRMIFFQLCDLEKSTSFLSPCFHKHINGEFISKGISSQQLVFHHTALERGPHQAGSRRPTSWLEKALLPQGPVARGGQRRPWRPGWATGSITLRGEEIPSFYSLPGRVAAYAKEGRRVVSGCQQKQPATPSRTSGMKP